MPINGTGTVVLASILRRDSAAAAWTRMAAVQSTHGLAVRQTGLLRTETPQTGQGTPPSLTESCGR